MEWEESLGMVQVRGASSVSRWEESLARCGVGGVSR